MMTPIEKMSTTDKVIESIRAYIQEPGRKPGEKLPSENELGKQLGVGRSSIREALRVLQTMGYVSIVHGKGAFIHNTEPNSDAAERWFEENIYALSDIYVVREMIEPTMASLAAKHITEEEVARLRQNLEHTRKVALLPPEKANPCLMAQLDEEFHSLICEATRNPFLMTMYKQIAPALHNYRQNSFAVLRNRQHALEPHGQILEALASHDAELAELSMAKHIAISKKDSNDAAKGSGIGI